MVKRAFATAPFLTFPDFNKRFVVATDASQTGIGGLLYQPDDEDNTITSTNIVAIVSKQLNESQRRYPVYKKELWAVVYCLRKFHTFIHGRRDVTVLTDHKPLIHILKQQNLCTALQQWLDVLLDYDLTIKYRPGVLHVIPDALSRMYMSSYSDAAETWGTHSNVRIIDDFSKSSSPSDFMCQQSIDAIRTSTPVRKRHQLPLSRRSGGGEHIHDTHNTEDNINTENETTGNSLIESISVASLRDDRTPSFNIDDEDWTAIAEFAAAPTYTPLFTHAHEQSWPYALSVASKEKLTDEEKLLIAQDKRGKQTPTEEQQQQLMDDAHAAGHYGEKAMYAHIENRGFWWPHMRDDIADTIKDCRDCQRYNITKTGYHPSQSITAARPGDHYQIDLAEFPLSVDGYKYCLVLIDVFTGFVILKPILNKEASTVARAVWEICCVIGVPQILQSDNGSEFSNTIVNTLCRLTGINRRFIAPYNPRADGKVERAVKTVKQTIVKLLHGASALWPLYIPFVQLAYNNKQQDLTGSTPFALMFGRGLNEMKDYTAQPHLPIDMTAWKEHQDKVVSLILPCIHDRIKAKQADMRKKMDVVRKKVTADELAPGTLVMIKDPTYLLKPSVRPSTQPMWVGPYTIIRRTLYGPYLLRDDTGDIYPRRVPYDQMKVLYSPTSIPKDRQDEESDTYVVEYIMDHRDDKGVIKYKVKWKGYGVKDATWETSDSFNDPATIERYFKLIAAKEKVKRVSVHAIGTARTNNVVINMTRC